jgi:uncharacterized membrane protein
MIELDAPRSVEQARWAHLTSVVARLAAIGAAVGWYLPVRNLVDSTFLLQNGLAGEGRQSLVLGVLGGASAMIVCVAISLLFWRWNALPRLERMAIAIAPLACFAPLPILLVPPVWYRNPLPFLVILAGAVLLLERTLRAWLTEFSPQLQTLFDWPQVRLPARIRRVLPLSLVVLGAASYTAYSLYYSVQQHHRLSTAAYDLGIYDNLMFTAMRGHPFRSTVLLGPDGPSYLVGHAEFAMVLFVPLYRLWPCAEMLLTLQAVALGFAAIPLYLFARTLLTRGAALVLAFSYLLYAPMHGSSFYDFHWLPLSIIFQFSLYYAIATNKNWLIGICYVVLTLIREDVSVGLAVLGIFLMVSGIRPKLGLFFAIFSAVSFVGIKFGIMLWAGPFFFADLYYHQLVAPGEQGFPSVTRTLMTNPAYVVNTILDPKKLNYFFHLMAPLSFIPLRKPLLLLLICSATLFTFLTTAYEPTVSISFQYSAHWIPYLFAAVVLMLGVVSRDPNGTVLRRAALGAVVFGVATHSYVFGAVLQHQTYVGGFLPVPFSISEVEKRTYADLRKVIAKIPEDASVAATDSEVPHVSNRFSIFTLRSHHANSDYLLINSGAVSGETKNLVKDAVNKNDYGIVAQQGLFYLFKRGPETPGTEKALQALGIRRDRKPSDQRTDGQ